MRIIGIDPGMAIIGYCVLDVEGEDSDCSFSIIASGSIQTDKRKTDSARLCEIHKDLTEIIKTYTPDVAAVEQLFYFKNAKTIIPVAQARGVIIMTLNMFDLEVFNYTPLVVKQTITGYGRADKSEIKEMVKIILNDQNLSKLDDTADATAIAICHARQAFFVNQAQVTP
jgi:crossover junction endodeoxyribonuclease RuvC